MIPLYTEKAVKPAATKPFNTGLWYNKFCDKWHDKITETPWSLKTYTIENKQGESETKTPKQSWIETVTGSKAGNPLLLKEALERQKELVANTFGECIEVTTQTSLITGMGNPHPVENGFTWHHLLGTPFIPASSVKGLVKDWVVNWVSEKDPDIPRIFGKQNGTDNTGSVVFLDAIPLEPVQLKIEIMTPHYGAYYESCETALAGEESTLVAPGDWLSPNPIPFLAVAPEQGFRFAVMPRHRSENDKDVEKVIGWLIEALETIGAGGKTAVGYGILSQSFKHSLKQQAEDDAAKKIREESERKDAANREGVARGFTGMALEIYVQAEQEKWKDDNGVFYKGAEHWLPLIKQENNIEIRKQAAQYLVGTLDRGKNTGIIREPEKVIGKKKKFRYRNERARELAKSLRTLLSSKSS